MLCLTNGFLKIYIELKCQMGKKNIKIEVLGSDINIARDKELDYISLTDISQHKDSGRSDDLIRNWLRNRNTIEFLGIWERLNNTDFNSVEFDGFRMQPALRILNLMVW